MIERHDAYLVMGAGPVELHYTAGNTCGAWPSVSARFRRRQALWKELKSRDVAGIGPALRPPSGLREFAGDRPRWQPHPRREPQGLVGARTPGTCARVRDADGVCRRRRSRAVAILIRG